MTVEAWHALTPRCHLVAWPLTLRTLSRLLVSGPSVCRVSALGSAEGKLIKRQDFWAAQRSYSRPRPGQIRPSAASCCFWAAGGTIRQGWGIFSAFSQKYDSIFYKLTTHATIYYIIFSQRWLWGFERAADIFCCCCLHLFLLIAKFMPVSFTFLPFTFVIKVCITLYLCWFITALLLGLLQLVIYNKFILPYLTLIKIL